jgi:hypothetical protein
MIQFSKDNTKGAHSRPLGWRWSVIFSDWVTVSCPRSSFLGYVSTYVKCLTYEFNRTRISQAPLKCYHSLAMQHGMCEQALDMLPYTFVCFYVIRSSSTVTKANLLVNYTCPRVIPDDGRAPMSKRKQGLSQLTKNAWCLSLSWC